MSAEQILQKMRMQIVAPFAPLCQRQIVLLSLVFQLFIVYLYCSKSVHSAFETTCTAPSFEDRFTYRNGVA